METQATTEVETKEQIIERLLEKSSLDFKCCGQGCKGSTGGN